MRSSWQGSLSCNLLTVPIKLYKAVDEKSTVKFNQLHRTYGTRIHQKKVTTTADGKEIEVQKDDIVKGFEIAKDQYVQMEESDFDAVKIPTISAVEIVQFIDGNEVDPRAVKDSYFMSPGKGGEKAFSLLLTAMGESQRKAIAKITMREREHIVMISPFEKVLLLQVLYWDDELRSCDEIAPPVFQHSSQELELAQKLIESMKAPWDPTEFTDDYREALMVLINDKAQGKVIAPPSAPAPSASSGDLLSQLMQSVEAADVK